MIGLGTLINVALVVAGGLVGLVGGRAITPRIQDALMKACAVCILFIGLSGALEGIEAAGTATIFISLTGGALIGELLDLEGLIERFGSWLKRRSGNSGDARFVEAFVSASLTVSIGAMAVVGSIQDGVAGDWSVLALKGAIDALIICVMSASMGLGCVFSAVSVLIFEGACTLLAHLLEPLITAAALGNLTTVGSMIIFCIGINLLRPKTFRAANMLPAMAIAVALAFL